jgi:hypothetical protein
VYPGYEDNPTRAEVSEAWRNFCNPGTDLYCEQAQGLHMLTWKNEFYPGTKRWPEGTGAVSRYKAEPEPEILSRCRILMAGRCAYPGASVVF